MQAIRYIEMPKKKKKKKEKKKASHYSSPNAIFLYYYYYSPHSTSYLSSPILHAFHPMQSSKIPMLIEANSSLCPPSIQSRWWYVDGVSMKDERQLYTPRGYSILSYLAALDIHT